MGDDGEEMLDYRSAEFSWLYRPDSDSGFWQLWQQ